MTENLESSVTLRLYTPFQIALASFFGTLLAGFFCLALNYKELRKRQRHRATLLLAAIIVPVFVLIYANYPDTPYDRFWPLAMALAMWAIAYVLQGRAIESAMAEGACRKSIPALIGMILFALVLLLVSLVVVMKIFGFRLT